MSKSRRKQNTDISRIVGILLLEVLAAIVLLNLVSFAQQQRTQSDRSSTSPMHKRVVSVTAPISVATMANDRQHAAGPLARASGLYSEHDSPILRSEKSLPKIAVGRYNVGW